MGECLQEDLWESSVSNTSGSAISHPRGSVNVQSLEKSLKNLLSELKQTQTPLALESDTMDSLTSRPSAQAVNQRVLHHNSELTNCVSRLREGRCSYATHWGA
uniref:Uncharacterized protein n=1 Tax=Magallana gigas TaxID=29159 RepID=A0A8W8M7C1_MAGGI